MLHYQLVPTANDSTPVLVWVKKKSYTAGLVQTYWSSGEWFNKTLENLPRREESQVKLVVQCKRLRLPKAKGACPESFVSNSQSETKSLIGQM